MTRILTYKNGPALITDLYQLTMAYAYWKNGMHDRESVFHLYYRTNPFDGNHVISAGLDLVIDYIESLKFSVNDIAYLANQKDGDGYPLFEEAFLNYLQRMEFTCDIDAIPEGIIVFPNHPLIRVKGPILQAQLIESALLNMVNFSSLIATKAARIVKAAQDDPVLEFGLRRAQGGDGGLTASRAAFIGGCSGTSNVMAGKTYGIPIKGTHAHSWVMAFDSELEAFEAYVHTFPHNTFLLVDTYDTLKGIKNAIKIAQALKDKNIPFGGIRLDSGDLLQLSIKARNLLDEAGFEEAIIVASNDLDEYKIATLKEKGAKITAWGVGTKLITANEQPALGGVYKLAALKSKDNKWEYRIKLSNDAIKTSNPGLQQVHRLYKNGNPIGDIISNELEENPKIESFINSANQEICQAEYDHIEKLLIPVYENGRLIYERPSIKQIRDKSLNQVKIFAFLDQAPYPYGLDMTLAKLKEELILNYRTKNK